MYGKLLLCTSFAAAEYLELFEDNCEKYLYGCYHHNKESESCGCWECPDCGKIKRCIGCLLTG